MTTLIDELSDTVYRDKAIQIVDEFVAEQGEYGTPVGRSQIYGLRQIAIQQPAVIKSFAGDQRERVEKKLETAGHKSRPKLEAQVAFWKLIADLCELNKLPWSPSTEAKYRMPPELRDENIPAKVKGMTQEDRGRRNRLINEQREWLERWNAEHVPAFLQRFCSQYLYHLGKHEISNQ